MRRFVDLHTHSTASDGSLGPAEVVAAAEAAHLAAIALTDHDTVDGLSEARQAASEFPDLHFIPGMEVSALYDGGTMHILAFGVDETSQPIGQLAADLVAARDERNPRIIDKLQSLGVDITMEDVLQTARQMHGRSACTVTSRVHIAETLRRKGHASTVREAFDRYIAAGAPAHVDKERMRPSQVVRILADAGAEVCLAHPVQLNCANSAQLQRVVRELMDAGLGAIEVYHSSHTDVQVRQYLDIARQFDLGVTGGSDFHGAVKPEVSLGHPRVPLSALTGRLAQLAGNVGR